MHLFASGSTHVGCRDDGTEAPCRGNGLQAGHTGTHDEHLGRRHGAGRRHHHREGAAELGGGIDHRLVAGQVGLAGQHVHGLGAGDARHQLHGKGAAAGLCQGIKRLAIAEGVELTGNDGAFLERLDDRVARPAHREDNVCVLDGCRGSSRDRRAGFLEDSVGNRRPGTGSGLHGNAQAALDVGLDSFRADGNACFDRLVFGWYGDLHLFRALWRAIRQR